MRRVLVVLFVAVGCGLDPGGAYNGGGGGGTIGSSGTPTSSSTEDATDQTSDGLCPSTSAVITGSKGAGDVCTTPSECASTCCDCGTGGQFSWLSASCVSGRCVDSVTSCSRTNARYCGGADSGGVISTPTTTTHVCGTTPATTSCDSCVDTNCCTASIACHSGNCTELNTCMSGVCAAQCGQ